MTLLIVPLSGFVDLKALVLFSFWQHYQMIVLILVGSLFYGVLGFCVGITRQTSEQTE